MADLGREDYELINLLMNNTLSLVNNLNILCDLECADEKDNKYFKEISENVRDLANEEELLYDRFNDDPMRMQEVLKFFGHIDDYYDLSNNLYLATCGSDDEICKNRIILNLIDRITDRKQQVRKSTIREDEDIDEEEDEIIDITGETRTTKQVKKDYINTVLRVMNIYLNDSNYDEIHTHITAFKYGLASIYSNVLKDFLDNDFNIKDNLYWYSYVVADINNIDYDFVEHGKIEYIDNVMNGYLENAMKLSSEDLEDKDVFAGYTLSLIFIRAALIFANEDIIESFKGVFEEYSNNEEENNNPDSIKEMMSILDNYYIDRELPSTISLVLKR